jgi:hypothetical protein
MSDRPEPHPGGDAPVPDLRSRILARARRFSPLLLVLAAAFVVGNIAPKLPRDRELELRIADPATVAQVDVAWALSQPREGSDPRDGDAVIRGGSWSFSPGSAPGSLVAKVQLPDGRYDLDVLVRRSARPDSTVRRSLTLGDNERVTVRVP